MQRYPGSRRFAGHYARSGERSSRGEREAAVAAELRAELGADPHVAVQQRDGYEGQSLWPPREKRGLVLVDPPFERPDEFAAVNAFLSRATARFANGVYAVWYPYKKRFDTERFLRRLRRDCGREEIGRASCRERVCQYV